MRTDTCHSARKLIIILLSYYISILFLAMILAILLKTIIFFLEYAVVTHTSLIELKGHQHMQKRVTPESNYKCILNFLCSLLKIYSNQTLLCLNTVSCLLSRAELLLLLVHHDLATSSFTFTHPL